MNLAAKHPEAIKGLILLNATPFWSQRPPEGQETLLWQLLNIDAALPVKHVSSTCGTALLLALISSLWLVAWVVVQSLPWLGCNASAG